jgi:phage-related protein (TIGR01555 family)
MAKKEPKSRLGRQLDLWKETMPAIEDAPVHNEIKVEADHMVKNGLSEAIMGFNPGGMGVELSQVDTLFKNNRWYLVSNMRQLCSEIYVEHGIIRTIVDVPVDDAMRGGVEIKSKQLDPEEIEKLEAIMERLDILDSVIGQAHKWNRLFGGAGILIMSDQDPETPLVVERLHGSNLEFRAVDMWELFYDKQNVEGFNPAIEDPKFDFYSYYGKKIHKSRVMKLKGLEAPSFVRPRLRGWGFSIVESLVRSLNQYLKSTDLTFEVLDEFKIDVYKIKNLTQTLLSATGTDAVRRRVALANMQKNYQSAITMDSEDDYQQKQVSFSGISEVQKEIRMQVACDMRMPLTKIFGISAVGFSSGEDDIENYNSMVESSVRSKAKFEILRILELLCQKEFGHIPDDLKIEFRPLRVLSSEQEENVKNAQFTRLLQAKQAGFITIQEFKEGLNKENLLPIQVDTSIDVIQDNVVTPRGEMVDEHKNLVKELEKSGNTEEAAKQKKELAQYEAGANKEPKTQPTALPKAKHTPDAARSGDDL